MGDFTDYLTTDRLNQLKAEVKELMEERTYSGMGGSLAAYAGIEWDFQKELQVSDPILSEHIQKIIDPLLQINDFKRDNSLIGNRQVPIEALLRAEKMIQELKEKERISQDTGCRGNCTGLCYAACYSACTGCISCSGSCSTACEKQCAAGCSGGCAGCTGGCFNGCTNTCGSGCTTGAKI